MIDYRKAEIEIRVRFPRSMDFCAHRIVLDEAVARELFEPLPRDRDLPTPAFESAYLHAQQERAEAMKKQRREHAEKIAQDLISALMELAESRDPQHGYSPKQWAELNR